MCLAVPVRILEVGEDGLKARVEHMGVRGWVGITLVPEAKEGDYILTHAGEALHILDRGEALKTLEIWERLYAANR